MKTRRNNLEKYNRMGYFYTLPFVVVFLIFSVYPVLRTLYLSFTNIRISEKQPHEFVGLDNYIRALTDGAFWNAFGNTVRIWGVNIILQLGLAFLLMMVFSDVKYKMKGLPAFRIVYYLPNLIAATSVAFLFQTLLDWRYGTVNQIINKILSTVGIGYNPIDWMGNGDTAGIVLSLIQTWMWFGNSFIMLMAAVQGISTDYFEAAALDGAGRWTVFFKITLPLIKPILLYVSITSLIGGLQLFDMPYLMVNKATASYDKVQTAVMYMYKFGFETQTKQVGYASAVAYILFIIIFAVSLMQMGIFNKKDRGGR